MVETATVETINVAVVDPAGTVTLAGTIAADELEDSCRVIPPEGAGTLKVTAPVELVPPGTAEGERLTPFKVVTVNAVELTALPTGLVTEIGPVVAACGTVAVRVESELKVNEAEDPLN